MLLLNMVTPDELYDDQDYNEILEDIHEECSKYGEIEGVRVPRPIPKPKHWMTQADAYRVQEENRRADEAAGVGRVYVLYKELESTEKAIKGIGGRQFANRTILVAIVPEVSDGWSIISHGAGTDALQEDFLDAPPPPPPEAGEDGPKMIEAAPPAEAAAPPPPPVDIDAAAADALRDLTG